MENLFEDLFIDLNMIIEDEKWKRNEQRIPYNEDKTLNENIKELISLHAQEVWIDFITESKENNKLNIKFLVTQRKDDEVIKVDLMEQFDSIKELCEFLNIINVNKFKKLEFLQSLQVIRLACSK